MTGLIRLQWWRDALDGIKGDAPLAHPVVAALYDSSRVVDLPHSELHQAINGREQQLGAEPPATLAGLKTELEATHSSIVRAALAILGADTKETGELARHAGIALGLVDLLYRLPADLQRDRLSLPLEMLRRHGVEPTTAKNTESTERLAQLVADLALSARGHLEAARLKRRDLPRQALAALLPARLANNDLKRLALLHYDPLAAGLKRPRANAPLILIWSRALGRF